MNTAMLNYAEVVHISIRELLHNAVQVYKKKTPAC